MVNGHFNQIMFEGRLELLLPKVAVGGLILLAVGLILLELRRANVLKIRIPQSLPKTPKRLSVKNDERREITMQPGLREDRKISEYEKKKMVANSVLTILEV